MTNTKKQPMKTYLIKNNQKIIKKCNKQVNDDLQLPKPLSKIFIKHNKRRFLLTCQLVVA